MYKQWPQDKLAARNNVHIIWILNDTSSNVYTCISVFRPVTVIRNVKPRKEVTITLKLWFGPTTTHNSD